MAVIIQRMAGATAVQMVVARLLDWLEKTVHVSTFAREVNQGEEGPRERCSGNLDWLRTARSYVVRASGAISSGR